MAIIPQKRLFCWKDIENLGDLKRLKLVLEAIPDESLMRKMEAERGHGRDDYPIRAMWNSILAGVVFQHKSVESLRRELWRNDRLRWICGFDPVREAEESVPHPYNYTRFLKNLINHQEDIDAMFNELVSELQEELPDFGKNLAVDSKGIRSHGRPRKKEEQEALERDGRRDLDADFGVKTYKGKRNDGSLYERVIRWFGYKLHLVVEADYEMPVAYEVTKASRPDNGAAKRMIDELEENIPELLEGCDAFLGDRAYDDSKLIKRLWGEDEDEWKALPIIPKREDWKDGEETRSLSDRVDNIVYDCQGQLYCYCWKTGKRHRMVYWGYEKGRDCQKWRCPAAAYGIECQSYQRCSGSSDYGRVVRVNRDKDRRTFLPVARTSYKFDRLYKKRTSVERVNGRLDVSFGFEDHFIRGQKKMQLRCSLALVVMLGMALGRIRENRENGSPTENARAPTIRSLVRAA